MNREIVKEIIDNKPYYINRIIFVSSRVCLKLGQNFCPCPTSHHRNKNKIHKRLSMSWSSTTLVLNNRKTTNLWTSAKLVVVSTCVMSFLFCMLAFFLPGSPVVGKLCNSLLRTVFFVEILFIYYSPDFILRQVDSSVGSSSIYGVTQKISNRIVPVIFFIFT